MGVVDLLQTIDNSKKSGVLHLNNGAAKGAIYFRQGAPIDAELESLRGLRALYRALLWTDGSFEIDFGEISREDQLQSSMQGVLMEGLRRLDEWGRLLEQLPDLEDVFEVSESELLARLAEIPDAINKVLRMFDGERSLLEIVDASDEDDLETLTAISKLYFEDLIYDTGRRRSGGAPAPQSTFEDEPSPDLNEVVLPNISSGPPVISHTLAPAWPGASLREDTALRAQSPAPIEFHFPRTPKLPARLVDAEVSAPERALPENPLRRHKQRKRRKRRGPAAAALARRSSVPRLYRAGEESEAREVDEHCAQITPSTIAPPPEDPGTLTPQEPVAIAMVKLSKPPRLPPSLSPALAADEAAPATASPIPAAVPEDPALASVESPGNWVSDPVPMVSAEGAAPSQPPASETETPTDGQSPDPSAQASPPTTTEPTNARTSDAAAHSQPAAESAPVRSPSEPVRALPGTSQRKRWATITAVVAIFATILVLRPRDSAPRATLIAATPTPTPSQQPQNSAQAAPPDTAAPSSHVAVEGATPPPDAHPPQEPAQAAGTVPATVSSDSAKPPEASPTATVTQVLTKGRSLEERGQNAKAIALYLRALNEAPGSSSLQSRLAFAYLNAGKNADAALNASRATQTDETNSEAWIVLGAAQDLLGKRQAAQAAYRNCASKGRGQYVTECRRMLH
jgi:hypothetical protein